MLISELQITGHCCLNQDDFVPLEQLTALIGPNDSGKSSLLRLLDHALNGKVLPQSDFMPDSQLVEVTLTFDVNRASEAATLQECIEFAGSALQVRYRFDLGKKPTLSLWQEGFADDRLNRLFSLQNVELDELSKEIGAAKSANKPGKVAAIHAVVQENPPPRDFAWRDCPSEVQAILPEFILFQADEDLSILSGPITQTLQRVYRRFLEERHQDLEPLIREASQILEDELTSLNPALALFLGGASLSVEPILDFTKSLQIPSIFLERRGERKPFNDFGDGTKRRAVLAVFHWSHAVMERGIQDGDRTVVWGFDEPDTHLHYQAQYDLLRELRTMTANGTMQILICTHSIPIIDSLPARAVRNMVPDYARSRTRIEWLKSLDEGDVSVFLSSVGSGLGFPNSLFFYERCFIVVEGETEMKVFPTLHRRQHGVELMECGIRLFSAESGGAALNLWKLLEKNGRDALLVLDNDFNLDHPDLLTQLESEGLRAERVVFLGDVELEDTFDSDVICDCLNTHYPRKDGNAWLPQEIDDLRGPGPDGSRRKFSGELVRIVGPGARRGLHKPEFGRKLSEEIDIARIPTQILEVLELARTLARSGGNTEGTVDDE